MLTHKRVEKRFDDITKSHNDKRLYRGLLLSNKMKVLLISDPTTNKSAAAMDVNTGNYPTKYITYLLEHQGEGSLLSVLTARGWCTSLRSENFDDFNGYGSFNIHVDLTLEGSLNVFDIIKLIFQYINILKLHGPVEWIYNEYRDIACTNFRFKEIDNLLSYVHNLAQSLQICHMKDVLWAGHIFTEWQPNLITQIMNNLTLEKVRIHLVALEYSDIVTATERWYGTLFGKTKITEELLDISNNAGYNSDLKFPSKKNEFITTKFDIKPETDVIKIIVQLVLNRQFKLEDGHFLYEMKYTSQKNSCAIVYYEIGLQSTESNVLLDLLIQIISQPFFDTLRTKEQLGYAMYSTVHKTINVQGLNFLIQSDKQPKYIEKRINLFIDSMLDYITTLPEEQFEKYKEAVAVSYLEKPKTLSAQSTLYWNEIITQQYNFNRVNIEISYLKTVTRQQLLNFYKKNVYNKAQYAKLSIHVTNISEDSDPNIIEQVDLSVDEEIKKINIMSFRNNQTLYPLLKPVNKYPKKGLSEL
ncbi:hypothetical protein P5V15_014600 [Pogonomyrmex californicus]